MDKGLACWPNYSIKEITKFPFNKVSDIFAVKKNIIFHNFDDNDTDGTFIIKALEAIRICFEIHVTALRMKFS